MAGQGPSRSERDCAPEPQLRGVQHLKAILEAVDLQLMIVNHQRQIVYANRALLESVGAASLEDVVGRRFGQAIRCIHATEDPEGCGGSSTCQCCGLLQTTRGTGSAARAECLLTVRRGQVTEPREYRIHAEPLELGVETLTLVSFYEISSEKRREVLEKVFFHDILNTITALDGYVDMLSEGVGGDLSRTVVDHVVHLTKRLRREVLDQRILSDAERDVLEPQMEMVDPGAILGSIGSSFAGFMRRRGQLLEVVYDKDAPELLTDPSLVVRVVSNMVTNAIEASTAGEKVRVWAEHDDLSCTFSVYNPMVIPDEVAMKIFKRSFSTKAEKGRGLGTYSMKLFGERYLGGEVSFTSTVEEGTIFSFKLPLTGRARTGR